MPRMGAVAGDARDGSGFRHCGRIRCTDLLRILEGRAGGPGLGLSTCVLWAEGTHRAADAEKPRATAEVRLCLGLCDACPDAQPRALILPFTGRRRTSPKGGNRGVLRGRCES